MKVFNCVANCCANNVADAAGVENTCISPACNTGNPVAVTIATWWTVKRVERQVLKGQELAYFKMGSTVIIVFEDSDKLDLHSLTTNKSVKFGSKLINLKKV